MVSKCDGKLAELFLAQFETETKRTECILSDDLSNGNHLYFGLTFSNEVLNSHVRFLEHRNHVLKREYVVSILNKSASKFSAEDRQKILEVLDFLSQKILYDHSMAIKAREDIKSIIPKDKANK